MSKSLFQVIWQYLHGVGPFPVSSITRLVNHVAVHSWMTVLKEIVGMGDSVPFIHRSGQFQTDAGGVMDEFTDLTIMLQGFQMLPDRAYCPKVDPRKEYESLPQCEFHDTYTILMAFQVRKLASSEVKAASEIFGTGKGLCNGDSEYARVLILSCAVVHDTVHWDKLVWWLPLIDDLVHKL
ncbi:hypothetical protein K469DRAFT_686891 [Zopfia rhizophila CBS 207.26]|uniref:Uncharacterized protein n=1 Tax=Zopfia rhizophila CBS 207.26 TaxID=1314779 RepID=A0A6A6E3M6_9PEZI|nr:hypothetical protein K469DRAFT_686891 [Zopfia rhizophila CBS 207.26]